MFSRSRVPLSAHLAAHRVLDAQATAAGSAPVPVLLAPAGTGSVRGRLGVRCPPPPSPHHGLPAPTPASAEELGGLQAHLQKPRIEASQSKILHIRGLPADAQEGEVMQLVSPYAAAEKILMIPRKSQVWPPAPPPAPPPKDTVGLCRTAALSPVLKGWSCWIHPHLHPNPLLGSGVHANTQRYGARHLLSSAMFSQPRPSSPTYKTPRSAAIQSASSTATTRLLPSCVLCVPRAGALRCLVGVRGGGASVDVDAKRLGISPNPSLLLHVARCLDANQVAHQPKEPMAQSRVLWVMISNQKFPVTLDTVYQVFSRIGKGACPCALIPAPPPPLPHLACA